jgi:hypothetical protein
MRPADNTNTISDWESEGDYEGEMQIHRGQDLNGSFVSETSIILAKGTSELSIKSKDGVN